MTNFIPVDTPGGLILVEVNASTEPPTIDLVSAPEVFRKFEETVNALKENAAYIRETLGTLAPNEIEVSFGIVVGFEAGISVFGLAKASGEANYSVTLKWKSGE